MGEETNNVPYNYYDDLEWLDDCYYKNGELLAYEGVVCTRPIKICEGVKIKLSSFYRNETDNTVTNYGARISFWKNGKWISDMDAASTRDVEYVCIPSNCDSVSLTLRKTDAEKYVYMFFNNINEKSDYIYDTLKRIYITNSSFYGKSVSVLGDSVSTYGGNTDDTNPNFRKSDGQYTTAGNRVRYPQKATLNLTNVNDTWWMRLIVRNKMKLIANESWAGSRVAWTGTEDGIHEGADIHIASQTRINRLEKNGEKPDIILVYAGTNDINHGAALEMVENDLKINYRDDEIATLDVSTFTSAYNTMLIRIKKSYPKSRIICILPYYTSEYEAKDSQITQMVDMDRTDTYDEIIKQICALHRVSYVDLREAGIPKCSYKKYLPDNLHPNPKGMEIIFEGVNKMF